MSHPWLIQHPCIDLTEKTKSRRNWLEKLETHIVYEGEPLRARE